MIIEVKREHHQAALAWMDGDDEGYYACNCIVAQAIRQKLPGASVSVGPNAVRVNDKTYDLPDHVRAAVKRFDETKLLEGEFNFELHLHL